MKRKQLLIVGMLGICLLTSACGAKEQTETASQEVTEVHETQEPEKVEETQKTEVQETENEEEDGTFWSEVGIKDGIGTIYNGDTIELVKPDENSNYKTASYTFQTPADFAPLAEAEISYAGADLKLYALEDKKPRIELSGDYELEVTSNFNDYGKYYDVIANGTRFAVLGVEGESEDTPIEECEVYTVQVYPTKGVSINGCEFADDKMRNFTDYFGDPNDVLYTQWSDGTEQILYSYEKKTITNVSSCYDFQTSDGKTIEYIYIEINFSKESILTDTETTVEQNVNERISVACDGRDGTADAPYRIGDEIVFPNYRIGYTDENKEVLSDVTLVVQEATSDYIKVSVNYGIDSWAGIREFDRIPGTYFFLRGFSEIGKPIGQYSDPIYKDEAGNKIEEFDENETTIEAYLSYEATVSEPDLNIGDAKYLVFVKMGTAQGEDPYTYIILE